MSQVKSKLNSIIVWGRKKAIRSGIETSIKTVTKTALQRPVITQLTDSIYKEALVMADKILRLPIMMRFVECISRGFSSNASSTLVTLRHTTDWIREIKLNI